MKIKKDTWFYNNFLRSGTQIKLRRGWTTTLCDVIKDTLAHAIMYLVLTIVGVVCIWAIINMLFTIVFALLGIFPSWILFQWGVAVFSCMILLGVLILLINIGNLPFWPTYISKYFIKSSKWEYKPPSKLRKAISNVWSDFKDKTCTIVELEND